MCGPCFSMIPNGSRQVPCAFAIASRKSPAVSSSHFADKFVCALTILAVTNITTRTTIHARSMIDLLCLRVALYPIHQNPNYTQQFPGRVRFTLPCSSQTLFFCVTDLVNQSDSLRPGRMDHG